MIEFFEDTERIFWAVHILGVAFGIGGATVTDLMFFRFMKNYKINQWESKTIALLSKLIWTGAALLIVSGIALYLPDAAALNESPLFLTKMVAVIVVVVNGVLLTMWMEPKMERISFLEDEEKKDEGIERVRRIAFALGAISFISWYSSYALAAIEAVPLSFLWLVTIFLGLVCVGVVGSQLVERYFEAKAPATEEEL